MTCIQPKIRHGEALAMYDAGANDNEIALRFHALPSAVAHWRSRHGLPSKHFKGLSASQRRQAMRMLRDGATRQQVSDTIGVCKAAIQRIRKSMPSEGLRSTGINQYTIRAQVLNNNDLYPRILRAVGSGLPRDVKHDAANEMYVDVLDGKLSADLIEARASRYRNRAWSICGSNYGPVSLDAANDDDFSLGDLIDDPAALAAMDEAAERAWGQGRMLG